MPKVYTVNEMFYSLQGEGARAGSANVFVRFSGCNLTCKTETHGFDCDTEFVSGKGRSAADIVATAKAFYDGPAFTDLSRWAILTGGEPLLQVDAELIAAFKEAGFKLAIETNGTLPVPDGIDWVTLSPKVAEHAVKIERADEVKYVRAIGQGIPKPSCKAVHRYISPAFSGGDLDRQTLAWCIKLVLEHPTWRLSVQQHKIWAVR